MLTDPQHTYLNRILKTLDPQIDASLVAETVASLRARADAAEAAGNRGEAEILRGAADKLEGGTK